jgi:parallel beta-helix repeat protein
VKTAIRLLGCEGGREMKKVVSGIMLILLLTGLLVSFNVQSGKASENTIYIRADGSIDPPTETRIERNGDVYTFLTDIYFDSLVVERDNIVVDGDYYMLKGPGSGNGITISGRSNVTIKNIEIKSFTYGVYQSASSNCSIDANRITSNSGDGIYLSVSSHNNIVGNKITNNSGHGVYLNAYSPWDSVVYSDNSIVGNSIVNNGGYGIYLHAWSTWGFVVCSDNSIVRNNIANNSGGGIQLFGDYCGSISHNSIVGNNITNNLYGIYLSGSSPYNFIYHNDFVNNTHHVYTSDLVNAWDNGYPSGGNYWSNYTGVDFYKGRFQNITGSDGIGDTPHIIDSNNEDRYPFINRTGWWSNTELDFFLIPNPAYVGQTVTMLGSLIDRLGHPLNNAMVNVFLNGTFKGNLFTNSSGWFKASARVNTTGTYIIKVAYSGSEIYKPSNHIETLRVCRKIDTNGLFTLSPNPAAVGQTITMLGNLTDVDGNLIGSIPLEVYTKKGSGSWQYIGTISTNSSGWFQASGKITSAGIYLVAVLYKGSYKYNSSYHIETLTVNPS